MHGPCIRSAECLLVKWVMCEWPELQAEKLYTHETLFQVYNCSLNVLIKMTMMMIRMMIGG